MIDAFSERQTFRNSFFSPSLWSLLLNQPKIKNLLLLMSTSIEADPFRAMLPYYFP